MSGVHASKITLSRFGISAALGALCLLSAVSAYAELPQGLNRYGSYPLSEKSLKRLKRDLRRDARMMRNSHHSCVARKIKSKFPWCDAEPDKLSNRREGLLGTNPVNRDSDSDGLKDYAELMRFHTNPLNSDTDGDGLSDGDEALRDHTDPLNPVSNPTCSEPNFDLDGNTSAFGIPAPQIGNIARGEHEYATRCAACHMTGEPTANMFFQPLKIRLSQAPMFITTLDTATLADLVAYLNRTQVGGSGSCTNHPGDPTPVPGTTPTPLPPVAQPTPTPSGCANEFFNATGDTTVFSIPAPLVGNIGQGASLYNLACSSCHAEKGTNFTFVNLKAAVTGPLMRISTVSDQQYAHLTAFLNRSKAAQNCGSPIPTPTPLDDRTAGMLVYQVTCQSCHNRPSEFRSLTNRKLQEAIKEKDEMNGIQLNTEQLRVLFIYFASL